MYGIGYLPFEAHSKRHLKFSLLDITEQKYYNNSVNLKVDENSSNDLTIVKTQKARVKFMPGTARNRLPAVDNL